MWFPEASFPEVTKLAYLNRRKSLGGLAKEHDEKLGHSSLLEASNPSPDWDVWGDAYFFLVSCRAPAPSSPSPGWTPPVNSGGRARIGFSALPDCWFHCKAVLSFLLAAVSCLIFFFLTQLCWPLWKNKPPPGSSNSEHAAMPCFRVCLTSRLCNHLNRRRARANRAAGSCTVLSWCFPRQEGRELEAELGVVVQLLAEWYLKRISHFIAVLEVDVN